VNVEQGVGWRDLTLLAGEPGIGEQAKPPFRPALPMQIPEMHLLAGGNAIAEWLSKLCHSQVVPAFCAPVPRKSGIATDFLEPAAVF